MTLKQAAELTGFKYAKLLKQLRSRRNPLPFKQATPGGGVCLEAEAVYEWLKAEKAYLEQFR